MTSPASLPGAGDPPDPGPFADLLGIRRAASAEGHARFEVVVERRHLNPHGVVHGGVLYSLADYAMGAALTAELDPGERCTTLELKVNYLEPATHGRLVAEARVLNRRKRIGVLEARVQAGDDRLIALVTGTFYIQASRA